MLEEKLRAMPDRHLLNIYRVAKKKLRPFFSDPRAMAALRAEVESRTQQEK